MCPPPDWATGLFPAAGRAPRGQGLWFTRRSESGAGCVRGTTEVFTEKKYLL